MDAENGQQQRVVEVQRFKWTMKQRYNKFFLLKLLSLMCLLLAITSIFLVGYQWQHLQVATNGIFGKEIKNQRQPDIATPTGLKRQKNPEDEPHTISVTTTETISGAVETLIFIMWGEDSVGETSCVAGGGCAPRENAWLTLATFTLSSETATTSSSIPTSTFYLGPITSTSSFIAASTAATSYNSVVPTPQLSLARHPFSIKGILGCAFLPTIVFVLPAFL